MVCFISAFNNRERLHSSDLLTPMDFSAETIVAIIALLVALPQTIFLFWSYLRRRRSRNKHRHCPKKVGHCFLAPPFFHIVTCGHELIMTFLAVSDSYLEQGHLDLPPTRPAKWKVEIKFDG